MNHTCQESPSAEDADLGLVRHAWRSTGLDVLRGVLCSTRVCVWCAKEQAKTYGGRAASWRWVR